MRQQGVIAQFWGAQAASLPFAAACREQLIALARSRVANFSLLTDSARQAAGRCRLAACAPQTGINNALVFETPFRSGATELPGQLHSQTEFGNEGQNPKPKI